MAGKSYPEQVLAHIAGYDNGMGTLDHPSAGVLLHVTQLVDGAEVRLDGCPCPRGEETLPEDATGRPVREVLGEGVWVSSARHTYADLVRDVVGG